MQRNASNKNVTLLSYGKLAIKGSPTVQEGSKTPPTAGGPVSLETMDSPVNHPQDLQVFTVGFFLAQLLGILCVALAGAWSGHYLGGFAWQSNPKLQFNYHPLFMVIGLVFLYGDAILVYRVMRNERKKILKLIHAGLHMLAFVFIVVALKAVFDSHNLAADPIPNMYSLHSWLGLSAVILFSLQFVCGFMSYLFPGVSQYWRAWYLPVHVYFGVVIYVLGLGSCLMGITEKLVFSLKSSYKDLPGTAVLGNILGVVLVCFGILVVYLVTTPQFKRQPLPEEVNLQLTPHSPIN